MSMPTFPQEGICLTREQALNMLLGSIAMEELALSHIMNAEGEKLQYILGTLPSSPCTKLSTCELLEVNSSVAGMLEHVNQSQQLLKGKLSQVLNAIGSDNRCCHEPCVTYLKSCKDMCAPFSLSLPSITCLVSGAPIPWKAANSSCCFEIDTPYNICIPNKTAVLIHYSFQVRHNEVGVVSVAMHSSHDTNSKCDEVFTCDGYSCTPGSVVTLSGSYILKAYDCENGKTSVYFTLRKPCSGVITNATLSLMAL